jgi:hypothetical protein
LCLSIDCKSLRKWHKNVSAVLARKHERNNFEIRMKLKRKRVGVGKSRKIENILDRDF